MKSGILRCQSSQKIFRHTIRIVSRFFARFPSNIPLLLRLINDFFESYWASIARTGIEIQKKGIK